MRTLIATLVIVCVFASDALAQTDAPAPSAVELRAQAEQMIIAADAVGVFVSEEHPPAVTLRHTRSGLLCRFGYGAAGDSITIVPSTEFGITRGDDVACNTESALATITFYATRYAEPRTAQEILDGTIVAIRVRHPGAHRIDVSSLETVTMGDRPPPPESHSAAFLIADNGQQMFTRVSVFARNGWVYKMRFSSPTTRSNFMADMFWISALTELPHQSTEEATH